MEGRGVGDKGDARLWVFTLRDAGRGGDKGKARRREAETGTCWGQLGRRVILYWKKSADSIRGN